MQIPAKTFTAGMASAVFLLLAACGGGGGSSTPKPTAVITADSNTVTVGASVTLDASNSHSPNSGNLDYRWSLIGKPDGASATLSTTDQLTTQLTPDQPGEWTVSLVVNDGRADSDPNHFTLSATPSPNPVATIKPISGALPRIALQLDGSTSQPPAGGDASLLRYQWTLLSQPEGSNARLDDPEVAWPRFTPDLEGHYRVQLIVHYEDDSSEPVEQTIEVLAESAPPTAVITVLTENPVRGQPVTFSAAGSSDPDGKPLNYFWSFGTAAGSGINRSGSQPAPMQGRPNGSQVVFENATSETLTFTPDIAGTYRIYLMAWSGKRLSFDSVQVVVAKPEGTPNTKPVAAFAPSYHSYSYEQEPGIGSSLRVNLGHVSWDADGDTLTREYTLLSYPEGFDPDASYSSDAWSSGFQPTHVGQYAFQLRVHDGTEWSDPVVQVYTVRVGANMGPLAHVKSAIGAKTSTLGGVPVRVTSLVGDTITLDGTPSKGGNNDEVFYQWELAYKPPGSTATLDEFRATHPKFVTDKEGPYLVRLQVRDADGLPSRNQAEVLIVAKGFNSPPVLRPVLYGRNHPEGISEEQPFLINGVTFPEFEITTSPLDPDGDAVDVLFTLVEAPAGFEWPEVTQWTPSNGNYHSHRGDNLRPNHDGSGMNVSGTYVFQVMGSDGMDRSALHTVRIPASTIADYPSLLMRQANGFDHIQFPDKLPFALTNAETSSGRVAFGTTHYLPGGHNAYWYIWEGEDEGLPGRYELRAPAGQEFTVVNLDAVSEDPTVPVRFIGLTEGQVIKPGEPVEFWLGVKKFADRTESNPETPYPKARWSFSIQERPDWTFHAESTLSGRWSEYPLP